MDTIWNCAFGLDIDLQNNPDNEYFKNSEKVFQMTNSFSLPIFFSSNAFSFFLIKTFNQFKFIYKKTKALFHELDHVWSFVLNFLNKILLIFGIEQNSFIWLNQKIDYLLERRLANKVISFVHL